MESKDGLQGFSETAGASWEIRPRAVGIEEETLKLHCWCKVFTEEEE